MKKKIIVAVVALVIVAALIDISNDPKPEESSSVESVEEVVSEEPPVEESAPERDYSKFFYDDRDASVVYMTVLQSIGEKHVNVKYPWGADDYTFADLNPEDDGLVVGTVKVTASGVVDKLEIICCFWTDGSSYVPHFFSCGGKVYVDDGTMDELFEKLGAIQ